MKTKVKAIIFAIFMLGIIGINSKVQAASASISATKTTATLGDKVTITVNVNAAAWNLKVTGSGVSGGSIVGYDPDGANSSTTKTYSLNTSSAGTYTIYLTGDVTDGSTDANSAVNTSVTVKVNNPVPVTPTTPPTTTTKPPANNSSGNASNSGGSTKPSTSTSKPTTETTKPKEEEKKSNDSTLKSLVVEGYELYPVFDANTREYNLRVANDIAKLTVIPTVNHNKAGFKLEGATEELLVGKNVITVVVTAEDGSSSNYIINVTRNREGLNVEHIKFHYIDEIGVKQELALNPVFSKDIFEYNLGTISHLISKLDVDVLANFAEAKIEVIGNENLVEGENTITITVTMPSESEEEADEVLKYTIKVEKQAEPVVTFMGRVQNWFNGITGTVSTWFNENVYEILMGALILCSFALGGLSVYLAYAYKKYKLILARIAELTKINNTRVVSSEGEIKLETSATVEENTETETKRRGRHF